jgi:hypothetical protein
MYQFYFLSIFMNILSGMALSSEFLEEKFPRLTGIKFFFNNGSLRLWMGIITAIVGFFKILSATSGDVRIVGDLLPAVSGLALGATLAVDYYKERSEVSSPAVETVEKTFLKNRSILGIGGILIGALHFLFPGVLFL